MKHTIHALSSLMNHEACPKEIFLLVFKQMPPLEYEEFGTQVAFTSDYLMMVSALEEAALDFKGNFIARFFFQENRTRRYIFDH